MFDHQQQLALHELAVQRVSTYLKEMLEDSMSFRGPQLRGTGPIAAFEVALAERSGFPFCLATSNATTALLVTALAAEFTGREIIVPPNSWGGTFGPFEFAGARLIRAEEDHHGNINPDCIERLKSPATSAVVAVDWRNERHNAIAIRQKCDAAGLLYIEDTSFIPSLERDDKKRSLADVQTISFGPGKPLTLGEGGALLTRHRWIYERAVCLSQHPERCIAEDTPTNSTNPFLNARMHPFAAVLGLVLLGLR
jgi:perosamine synthetase